MMYVEVTLNDDSGGYVTVEYNTDSREVTVMCSSSMPRFSADAFMRYNKTVSDIITLCSSEESTDQR